MQQTIHLEESKDVYANKTYFKGFEVTVTSENL